MATIRARVLRTSFVYGPKLPWAFEPRANPLRKFLGMTPKDDNRSLDKRRAEAERLCKLFPSPRGTRFELIDADGVKAEWTDARDCLKDRVVLYFHGGGFIMGSNRTHRSLTAFISRTAGARVLSVDYSLAPEHPFPAGLNDCVGAYKWLRNNGYEPETVIFAGDSAGGNLTIATMLALKAQSERLPAAGVCLSPGFDLALTGKSLQTLAGIDPIIHRGDLEYMVKSYLPDGDPTTETASPLYGDLTGLPPVLIQVGSDEVLLDDSRRFAQRAREMGVQVQLAIYQDMTHVWQMAAGIIPEARKAVEEIGDFMKSIWTREGTVIH